MSARRSNPWAPRRLGRAGVTGVLTVSALLVAAHPAGATPVTKVSAKRAALARLSAHHATPAAVATVPDAVRRALRAHRARLAPASARPASASTPSDLEVAGTAGVLTLRATSSAAFVSFAFDGVAVGAPVAVSAGSAAAPFASWGFSNGVHAVTAADCATSAVSSCDAIDADGATVDLRNVSPTVITPANGTTVTGGFTISGASSGGGLAFLVDGRRIGFDATSPYRFDFTGSALTPGRHAISLAQCSVSGARCAGPESSRITVTSNSLHPRISSLSPYSFSPNRDHVKDLTTLTFTLPETESATVTVTNAHGTVVRGPVKLGALVKGRHTWSWTGTAHSGKVVPEGRYQITLNTSATVHGAVVTGQVWSHTIVDLRAPKISVLSGNSSIYPYHDGYRDTFAARFHLDENATVTLTVRTAHNRTVRSIKLGHNAGHVVVSWSGRDAHLHIVPSGSYNWYLTVRDSAGNSRHTKAYRLRVSAKKLVTVRKTITRNGDSFYSAGASDPSCAEASTSDSDYRHGIWLMNGCADDDVEIAAAFYHVTLPAAVVYTRISVAVNGYALFPPTSIEAGFGVHGGSSDFGFGGFYQINTQHEGWYGLGSVNAADYVSAHHVANIVVSVDSTDAPCDFDVNQVRTTVTYKVLR